MMQLLNTKTVGFLLMSALLVSTSGCAMFQRAREADALEDRVGLLEKRLRRLQEEKNSEIQALLAEKEKEAQAREKLAQEQNDQMAQLNLAKRELESRLSKEINDYRTKLEMNERGLVITFLSELFFDSGKDLIREEGREALAKVAAVLNKEATDSDVAVEGYTDNEPIKYSGWKSNWELSSGRALSVLHYLIEELGVDPERLSANGYGQFHPVASDDTPEGKQQNRRVEIVVLPPKLKQQQRL